jgi:hypothetical protein
MKYEILESFHQLRSFGAPRRGHIDESRLLSMSMNHVSNLPSRFLEKKENFHQLCLAQSTMLVVTLVFIPSSACEGSISVAVFVRKVFALPEILKSQRYLQFIY